MTFKNLQPSGSISVATALLLGHGVRDKFNGLMPCLILTTCILQWTLIVSTSSYEQLAPINVHIHDMYC